MQPLLEPIAESQNYGDLPETWRVPDIEHFSAEKSLYDYQTGALKNAARALFLYYGKDHAWTSGELSHVNEQRKQDFAKLYAGSGQSPLDAFAPKKYDSTADERNEKQSAVFKILSESITPTGDSIPYYHLINRMCFWMATGSGKTLVMVKLIEYLHALKQHGEIPAHNILILAPSNHLIGQIRRTIAEFNQTSGLQIDLLPLRQAGGSPYQQNISNSATVYYHRSDNISDVQKEALTDYRTYQNDGNWYVLLDEAHKGGKENSKRQAYYALMARQGFLFNFSATFTDHEDIATTVKKYNLEEFTKNGYGKSVYLNEKEYDVFRNRQDEISQDERQKIVLKSLITLAHSSMHIAELRDLAGLKDLYHIPLMLTLVNSVNTGVKNDLLAFFQTLRAIAMGEIDNAMFVAAKRELTADWENARMVFGEDGGGIVGMDGGTIKKMKIADLREAVFLSRRKGAVQFIRSSDNKELAFQLKNADSPFALIRIGDTSKWRNDILQGYEQTTALQEKSFFDELEHSPITILMGSRSFFESWDSNRPNVINFINIGGADAKKFVVQSVGRGVRIEPLRGKRRRLSHLLSGLPSACLHKAALAECHGLVQPAETLFVFATNRAAVNSVLQGLKSEKGAVFEELAGFEKAPVAKIGNRDMPLLVPAYKEAKGDTVEQRRFAMSEETLMRFKDCVERTSDALFTVRDGLASAQIIALRDMVKDPSKIEPTAEKEYAKIAFLQQRVLSYLATKTKVADGVRQIGEEDIVHFRHVRVRPEYLNELTEKVGQVKLGKKSDETIIELGKKFAAGELTREAFGKCFVGEDEATYNELTIKKLAQHYYVPVILGGEKTDYLQHIIKVPSEVEFLQRLEVWLAANTPDWDAWMFSRIDEALDTVHIPYTDANSDYRRFFPDFVFWMVKEDRYQIVFVDPKGTKHTGALHKIDGYKVLFETDENTRSFRHGNIDVEVKLLMFNNPQNVPSQYRRYWSNNHHDIFKAA